MFGTEVPDPIVSALLTLTVMLLVAGIGGLVRLAMIIAQLKSVQDDHHRRLTEVERRVFNEHQGY